MDAKNGGGYRSLVVYQRSMQLAEEAYRVSRRFPDDEKYGMSSQLRRAAVSIPANIAEGHGRYSDAEFARFLRIANGSLREVETLIDLCVRVGLMSTQDAEPANNLSNEIGRMLVALIRTKTG